MAEQVPQESQEAPAPSAPAPAITPEIQSLIAAEAAKQANDIVDKRVPGLQSTYERQIASLRREVKEAREANLSPEELRTSESERMEEELAKARREADALRAGRSFPEAFPVFEAMTSAPTVEDQLDILTKALRPDAGSPDAAPAQSPTVPAPASAAPVDPNRPLTPPVPSSLDADNMSQSAADQILGAVDRWPTEW
jgi:hypothetical protein